MKKDTVTLSLPLGVPVEASSDFDLANSQQQKHCFNHAPGATAFKFCSTSWHKTYDLFAHFNESAQK